MLLVCRRRRAALCCALALGLALPPAQPLPLLARGAMAHTAPELVLKPLCEDSVLYRQQRQLLGPLARRLRFPAPAAGDTKVDGALMAALRARVLNHQDAYFACPPFSAAADAADASAPPSDAATAAAGMISTQNEREALQLLRRVIREQCHGTAHQAAAGACARTRTTSACVHVCVCVCACVCARVRVRACVLTRVCMCTRTHMRTRTHTHEQGIWDRGGPERQRSRTMRACQQPNASSFAAV